MMHDVSGPGVIKVFNELEKKGLKLERIWDPDKVWITEDILFRLQIEFLQKI